MQRFRIPRPSSIQTPHRDPQEVLPPAGPVPLDPLGQGAQYGPASRRAHPGADRLAEHGVGERHFDAPLLGRDGDQSTPLGVVDCAGAGHALQQGEPDRAGLGQQFENRAGLTWNAVEAGFDEFDEAARRGEGAAVAPHPVGLGQSSCGKRAEHQFADIEGIALRALPQGAGGAGGERAPERRRHELVDLTGRERLDLDAGADPILPKGVNRIRCRLAGTDRDEDRAYPLGRELVQQRRRAVVQ